MKKFRKLISAVMALSMTASMAVMPASADTIWNPTSESEALIFTYDRNKLFSDSGSRCNRAIDNGMC